jgi:hypothetical protein
MAQIMYAYMNKLIKKKNFKKTRKKEIIEKVIDFY